MYRWILDFSVAKSCICPHEIKCTAEQLLPSDPYVSKGVFTPAVFRPININRTLARTLVQFKTSARKTFTGGGLNPVPEGLVCDVSVIPTTSCMLQLSFL